MDASSDASPDLFAKGFAKYRPDQARDQEGQWTDEGKADSKGSGWGRTAAIAGAAGAGLLGLAALDRKVLGPVLRASNRRANYARLRRLAQTRTAEGTRLRERAQRAQAGSASTRVGRATQGTQSALNRSDAKWDSRLDHAVNRVPVSPKARRAIRNEMRHGSQGPDPAGKLIDFSWLNPF